MPPFPESIPNQGQLVHKGKIEAAQPKLDRIREWRFTTSGIEMASFPRLCYFYRRLIAHFAHEAVSLYTHAGEPGMLPRAELSCAFAELNSDLCDRVPLKLPNTAKPFVLETDTSLATVCAGLKQIAGDEDVSTILYSLSLNPDQRNYSWSEREILEGVKPCDAF